ncbi:MAG: polyphosphate kinase 2 family protein [Alphaproteobacteria bacterium]|nr:polyphosphate kinase 2 family protein [Alphaproteobacteria bacterium]MDE2336928.1 polyphosphate kinase 2 family protein [Alphaproteobacteria bacterium]
MVKPGDKVDLNAVDTGETCGWTKSKARTQIKRNLARIAELQEQLYVEKKRGLLIVLQAMDTGGKDGTIRTLGSAMNPAGTRVVAFKKPTAEEKAHGFLWRIRKHLPKAGEVVIFNRSHYEDVGIARVHGLVPEKELQGRYDEINEFEDALALPTQEVPEGTHVLKFFLHIGKAEQLERFRDRLDDPAKQWKLSEADFAERQHWDDYMEAYSLALSKCTTADAPWFVVPADNKWMRDLIVSQVVVDYLEGLRMKPPAPTVDVDKIRKKYFGDPPPAAKKAAVRRPFVRRPPSLRADFGLN